MNHDLPSSLPYLVVVASRLEAEAITRAFAGAPRASAPDWTVRRLSTRFRLVEAGIGKVNAAAAVARALGRGKYHGVLSIGIGGALPGSGLGLGDVVLGDGSVFADEGIVTPGGFQTCAQMGFPLGAFEGNMVPGDPGLVEALSGVTSSMNGRVGRIATVSTCSGTDEHAATVAARTGAIAEGMEGAAVGQVVARYSAAFPRRSSRFVELRVISNTTGNRASQRWDMKVGVQRLTELSEGVAHALE